jgi:hypothetical protein
MKATGNRPRSLLAEVSAPAPYSYRSVLGGHVEKVTVNNQCVNAQWLLGHATISTAGY